MYMFFVALSASYLMVIILVNNNYVDQKFKKPSSCQEVAKKKFPDPIIKKMAEGGGNLGGNFLPEIFFGRHFFLDFSVSV